MSCILCVSVFRIIYFSLRARYAFFSFCNVGPVYAQPERGGITAGPKLRPFFSYIYIYTCAYIEKNALWRNGWPLVTQRDRCQLLLLLLSRLYGRPSLSCPRGEERAPPTHLTRPRRPNNNNILLRLLRLL